MKYRKFGNTDLIISEIGFGAWAIGGGAMIGNTAIGWGDADDQISIAAIHQSVELGINFFDTADIYGLGHSEELIGKTIGKRKDIIIASKAGNVSRNNQFTVDYTKAHIINACEASLKRLERETIDYYQLHTARLSHLQQGECIEAMQLLQQTGKIRYWGLSLNTFEPFTEADYMIKTKIGEGFQLVYNIINQTALPVIKNASAAGYGIIARMPLQFGLLTGKFDNQLNFSENDHRKKRLTKELVDICKQYLTPVWELCKKYNVSKTELALSFILNYPEITTVITGIRTPNQAEINSKAIIALEKSDVDLIENLGKNVFVELMKIIKQQ